MLALLALFALCHLSNRVNGLYFFMEKGQVKCFKDELVKNSVRLLLLTNTCRKMILAYRKFKQL